MCSHSKSGYLGHHFLFLAANMHKQPQQLLFLAQLFSFLAANMHKQPQQLLFLAQHRLNSVWLIKVAPETRNFFWVLPWFWHKIKVSPERTFLAERGLRPCTHLYMKFLNDPCKTLLIDMSILAIVQLINFIYEVAKRCLYSIQIYNWSRYFSWSFPLLGM